MSFLSIDASDISDRMLAKIFHTTAGYLIDGEKVELEEDIMQVVMMLQEMPEELRKVAMEQVKVLMKLM